MKISLDQTILSTSLPYPPPPTFKKHIYFDLIQIRAERKISDSYAVQVTKNMPKRYLALLHKTNKNSWCNISLRTIMVLSQVTSKMVYIDFFSVQASAAGSLFLVFVTITVWDGQVLPNTNVQKLHHKASCSTEI